MAYDFNNRNWENEINEAERRKRAAEAALSGYGSFSYGRESQREGALDALLNRGKFKYDLDKDALYKQIRDNYSALGKLAMQDTIGQASAMTGGYGNSYAASAGQQAYNQYMQKAQDTIPQLYQMALDRYNAEGNRLSGNLAALNEDRSQRYSEWQGEYNRLAGDRDYAASDYNSVYNAAYQIARDKIADEQWERQFAASQRKSSGGSGSNGGNKGYSNTKMTSFAENAVKAFIKDGNSGLENYVNGIKNLSQDEADWIFNYVLNEYDYMGAGYTNLNSPWGIATLKRESK